MKASPHFFWKQSSLAFLCLSLNAQAAVEPNPLGVFSFDLKRLGKTQEQQIEALAKMGFSGVALDFRGSRNANEKDFTAYHEAARAKGMQVYAVFLPYQVRTDQPLNPELEWKLDLLKSIEAALWVSFRKSSDQSVTREQLLQVVNEVADACARKGVRCVLYPHDNFMIETAEEAVSVIEESGRKDVSVSLHVCHEIRGGNGARLKEVAQAVKPYLYLPTISGADNDSLRDKNWNRTIQPLGDGDYDVRQFIEAIRSIDYKGPVILHTFGLQKLDADHHGRSMDFYRNLFR